MKRFIFSFLFCLFSLRPALSASLNEVQFFAKDIADALVKNVMQANIPVEEKRQQFKSIFVHKAGMDIIVKFVLGATFRTTPPEQIKRFKTVFTENFVLTWADRFDKYNGESVIFKETRQNKKDFYVTSEIDIPNTEKPIDLIWRIREEKDGLKVVDLVAEGVSMLQNYRKEYSSILQQNDNNVQILISLLENKNKKLAQIQK